MAFEVSRFRLSRFHVRVLLFTSLALFFFFAIFQITLPEIWPKDEKNERIYSELDRIKNSVKNELRELERLRQLSQTKLEESRRAVLDRDIL